MLCNSNYLQLAHLLWQVPLESLSSQLQAYLQVLKGRLVEVINEDYNDFVSLSTKLVNVDGAVAQMQKPLLLLKASMQHACKLADTICT